MVDVDRRLNVGQRAHVAGLKRLSARASKGQLEPSASPRQGCFSFGPLARAAMDRLIEGKVQIARGLTEEEFCRIEALFAFTFPPDLKAILQEGLPVGVGFPDWRSGSSKQLRLLLNLPITGLFYEVACGRFWLKQWGIRPADTEQAVAIARSALKKAPILIPVYRNCHISSSPNLAGNPVFFVRQQAVFCSGLDLADFFERQDFVLHDCKLPHNFLHIGAPSSRDTSLRVLQAQSFRADDKLCGFSGGDNSLACKKRDIDEVDLGEHTHWRNEDSSGDLEGWGRNLDSIAKRSGHDAQARGSFEMPNSKAKVGRRQYVSLDFAGEHHANNRAAFTNASAKARRIDFWSDLAKKHMSSNDCMPPIDIGVLVPNKAAEKSMDRNMDPILGLGNEVFSCAKVDSEILQKQTPTPYWLERYFDKISMVLRNGGWKETDITDMFGVDSPSSGRNTNMLVNPQIMMQGLVLYVSFLSDALRRAGWSTTDVAEAFDVDFPFCEQKKRAAVVPPHVAAKIGKLAEYAAQI